MYPDISTSWLEDRKDRRDHGMHTIGEQCDEQVSGVPKAVLLSHFVPSTHYFVSMQQDEGARCSDLFRAIQEL
jgi:hypothetical protein